MFRFLDSRLRGNDDAVLSGLNPLLSYQRSLDPKPPAKIGILTSVIPAKAGIQTRRPDEGRGSRTRLIIL